MKLSKITSTRGVNGDPPRLCKLIEFKGGGLKTTPGARLTSGTVERVNVGSVHELGELFDTLGTNQALTYGVTDYESAPVMSRAELARNPTPGAITRTRDHFKFADGPGVLYIDYDPPKGTQPLSADELVGTLRDTVPELREVDLLCRPSAGSCIFDDATGEELRGVRGQHVYCTVKRASDIPAMVSTIDARLWIYGHGRVDVSESGKISDKTPIDTSVAKPEQLDFTRAECGHGLVQRMAPSRVFAPVTDTLMGGVDLFAPVADPLDSIEPLTKEEQSFVAQLKQKAATAPDIVQKVHDAKTAHRLKLARERARPGDDIEALALSIGRDLDAGILSADHPIKLQDGTLVTVADILKNPAHYHGKKCADPLEPGYGDRRTVGMIQTERYPPRITT